MRRAEHDRGDHLEQRAIAAGGAVLEHVFVRTRQQLARDVLERLPRERIGRRVAGGERDEIAASARAARPCAGSRTPASRRRAARSASRNSIMRGPPPGPPQAVLDAHRRKAAQVIPILRQVRAERGERQVFEHEPAQQPRGDLQRHHRQPDERHERDQSEARGGHDRRNRGDDHQEEDDAEDAGDLAQADADELCHPRHRLRGRRDPRPRSPSASAGRGN